MAYVSDTVHDDMLGDVVVRDFTTVVRDNEEKIESRHNGVAHLDVVLQTRVLNRIASIRARYFYR
jgi:hypothetical protein